MSSKPENSRFVLISIFMNFIFALFFYRCQNVLCWSKVLCHLLLWHKKFKTARLVQCVNQFLDWHKKFGPAQNVVEPLEGQGIRFQVTTLQLQLHSIPRHSELNFMENACICFSRLHFPSVSCCRVLENELHLLRMLSVCHCGLEDSSGISYTPNIVS